MDDRDTDSPNRRLSDVVTHDRLEMVQQAIVSEFKTAVAKLEASFQITEQKILSELAQLKQTTEFADRQNAQNIAAVSARVTTAEGAIKDVARDLDTEIKSVRKEMADGGKALNERADNNRRLIYQTLIAPVLVFIVLFILGWVFRGGFA